MNKIISKQWKESLLLESEEFNKLRIENKFCDIILRGRDGIDVNAHRTILNIRSNFFKDLFSSGMDDSKAEILPFHMNGKCLSVVIAFIYTGELDVNLDAVEEIEEIARCASYFQIEILTKECMKALYSIINEDNCLRIWRLADECFSRKFENLIISYIKSSDNQFYKTEKFLSNLTAEELKKIIKFSKHNEFTEEEIDNYYNLQDLITPKYEKRICFISRKKMLTLDPSTLIENCYSIKTKENIRSVSDFASCVFNNHFLLCGGSSKRTEGTNQCEYLNPIKNEWRNFPSLNEPKRGHECIFFNDKIYSCGGFRSNSYEFFDFGKEKWINDPNYLMLHEREDFGLSTLNGALYAIGGRNEPTVEMLDPRERNKWVKIYNELEPSNYTKCVVLDNLIYCFDSESIPYIFDIKFNRLVPLEKFHKFPPYFKVCASGGCIYVYLEDGCIKCDRYGQYIAKSTTHASLSKSNLVSLKFICNDV